MSVLRTRATAPSPPPSTTRQAAGPHAVAVADLDGDGKPDLAVTGYDDGTVSVLLNNGDGTFAAPRRYPTGAGPGTVAAADLNGDGSPDLVVTNGQYPDIPPSSQAPSTMMVLLTTCLP